MDYRMKRFENALNIFQKWKELFFILVIFILSAGINWFCISDIYMWSYNLCKNQPFEGNDWMLAFKCVILYRKPITIIFSHNHTLFCFHGSIMLVHMYMYFHTCTCDMYTYVHVLLYVYHSVLLIVSIKFSVFWHLDLTYISELCLMYLMKWSWN